MHDVGLRKNGTKQDCRIDGLPLVSAVKEQRTIVRVGNVPIGGDNIVVVAGPCSVETREQINEVALFVKAGGASILRGGAYKPRTSPYDFQGLGLDGLKLLQAAGKLAGIPIVTEVMSEDDTEVIAEHADMLQVGARNMQNFALLKKLSKIDRPVLLKRGASATVKEWLAAAEYILHGGNDKVVLCERGIRTFDNSLRNTLDLAGVALAMELSHLPVLVDPSHATGRRSLIAPTAKAAIAVGADGVIVEVHPRPDEAWSDGAQSLDRTGFEAMIKGLFEPQRTLLAA